MSVIKNNLSRLSSFRSFKTLNNKQNNISGFSFGRKTSSKKVFLNFGISNSNFLNNVKHNEMNNINQSNLKPNDLEQEKNDDMNKKYRHKNIKSIIKYIRTSFLNKYSISHYEKKDNISNNMNNNYVLLYDYFKITDILENKKCLLVAKLNEYKYTSNKIEFLIRYYKPKERYIIMKYLLNFVYKFDKLCFDEKKEITDTETKEAIIKTFYYITSEQYTYEHLFENDSFKGMQTLLKHINLANKKASYDYSYLDITKNTSVSKENEVIINTLKLFNEYINNRNYIQKKLIKDYPIERVPNAVPNYIPLGNKINIYINNYRFSKKYVKIENHEETKELINRYKKEFSQHEENDNQKSNLRNKELFNIQENIEENESGKSDFTSNIIKKVNINKSDFKIILTESMNNISKFSNKNESSKELIANLKENFNDNKFILNANQNFSNNKKRYDKEPETKDIENLLEKISFTPKKINYNAQIKYTNKEKENKRNIFNKEKERKENKVKFRTSNLRLRNENKSNENYSNIKSSNNLRFKNKLMEQHKGIKSREKHFKNKNSAVISNFKESYLKIKNGNINNKNNPKIFNNITSSFFKETNFVSRNLSSSFKILKKKNNVISNFKKNYINQNQRNILNNYLNIDFSKFIDKNSNLDVIYKDTESFIKGTIENKNKMKLRPNIILKNFSTIFTNTTSYNKSSQSLLRISPSKRYTSLSPQNTLKNIRRLFKKTDFEKLVFKMNKKFIIAKKKESKSYTFKQVLKNCEIYNTKFF